jgi:hypothetical protein
VIQPAVHFQSRIYDLQFVDRITSKIFTSVWPRKENGYRKNKEKCMKLNFKGKRAMKLLIT